MAIASAPSRNGPCPCGSGRKYKNCYGKKKEICVFEARKSNKG